MLSSLSDRFRRVGEAPPVDEHATSPEARRHAEFVTRMYRTCFGRMPEPEGLAGWLAVLLYDPFEPIQVAQAFVASPEFRAIHGPDPTPEAFVAAACRNALGREPDPADFRKWVDFLTEHGNGKPARAATAIGIAQAMAFIDGGRNGDAAADRSREWLGVGLQQWTLLITAQSQRVASPPGDLVGVAERPVDPRAPSRRRGRDQEGLNGTVKLPELSGPSLKSRPLPTPGRTGCCWGCASCPGPARLVQMIVVASRAGGFAGVRRRLVGLGEAFGNM